MFDLTFSILPQAMNAASVRNSVIAQNIANQSTPDYKRKYVTFEEEFQKALGSSDEIALKTNKSSHINNTPSLSQVQPQILQDASRSNREDGNNVNVDVESVNMYINGMYYNGLTRLMNYSIQRYNTVIKGVR